MQLASWHRMLASTLITRLTPPLLACFRYALRRRQTRKKDFVSYIEYEMNCEKLRLRRKEARPCHIHTVHTCSTHNLIRTACNASNLACCLEISSVFFVKPPMYNLRALCGMYEWIRLVAFVCSMSHIEVMSTAHARGCGSECE